MADAPISQQQGDHTHEWVPLKQWMGRYRCTSCRAIGYRASTVMGKGARWHGDADHIEPYKCEMRGCDAWATAKDWIRLARQWRCRHHRAERERDREEML